MSAETVVNSLLLALGLALEAFLVALANGLKNADMRVKKACLFGAIFASFHVIALIFGYALVKSVVCSFEQTEEVLSWIAVAVLVLLGVKMIVEGVKHSESKSAAKTAEFTVQSIVASFDAFAVGLTVSDYGPSDTAFCSATIAVVIFAFFLVGFVVGKKFGNRFTKLAAVLGGAVFIGIGAEIAFGILM